ncbi:MAG: hypothetical protein LBN39_03395 [Planctomycetaceae bacterium]|nr:hypothetical protein [Planctomycetaceae bacterium]
MPFFAPLFLIMLTGCLCDPEYCRMPDLLHPGHISKQQEQMRQFDPFTRSDIAPAINGDRPNGCLQTKPAAQQLGEMKK